MSTSLIEWTEETWNPLTGCTKISAGCKHCYAERMATRLQAMGLDRYRTGFKLAVHPETLDVPRRWKRPRMVFVNSMSDLFHDRVSGEFIHDVFRVMNETPWHTYQVLTKRALRLWALSRGLTWTPNIWMGVSVESHSWRSRIRLLREVPATVRFLSCEPLLGPLPNMDLRGIHWVIVGGESGPGARPMHPDWARGIRDQCQAAGIAFFFKQWGEWKEWDFDLDWDPKTYTGFDFGTLTYADNGGVTVSRIGKKRAGRVLDGRTWDEFPTKET